MVAIQTVCFLLFHCNLGRITPPTTVDELFMSLASGGGTGFPYLEVGAVVKKCSSDQSVRLPTVFFFGGGGDRALLFSPGLS